MWVKPVFSGWDKSGTLISKFEENYRDIDIKNITVSHCDQTKCIGQISKTYLVKVHEPLVLLDECRQHPVRPDGRRPAQGLPKVAAKRFREYRLAPRNLTPANLYMGDRVMDSMRLTCRAVAMYNFCVR